MSFGRTGLHTLPKFMSSALLSTAEYAWIDRWVCLKLNHRKVSPILFSSLPLVFVAVLVAFTYQYYLRMFASVVLVFLHGPCGPSSISAAADLFSSSTRQHLLQIHHQPDPTSQQQRHPLIHSNYQGVSR